jgi:hypothetical protein
LPSQLSWLFELLLVVLDPVTSSAVAAVVIGEPTLAPELLGICRRESHCRWVGAHKLDAWAGPTMYRNAVRVGWLDPQCTFHRGTDPMRYSTRGAHGLSAAYSLRFVGGCLPPEALDVPFVSALAAARRAHEQCKKHRACTREGRRRYWVGAGRYDKLTRERARPLHASALPLSADR